MVPIGTDRERVLNFGYSFKNLDAKKHIVSGEPFVDGFSPLLTNIKKYAYKKDGVPDATRMKWEEGRTPTWYDTQGYRSRPLHAVWATLGEHPKPAIDDHLKTGQR